jgi:hypothetical protein
MTIPAVWHSGGWVMRTAGLAAAAAMLFGLAVPALPADDLASKMVNDPSAGWAAFGTGAKVELYKDAGVQGGVAERLTIDGKGANPWDAGANVAISKPLKKGDVLLLAFWAKSETPPEGAAVIDFKANIQNNAAPYNSLGSAMLHVGPQWKMYFAVATADKDYPANAVAAQLQLAVGKLTIDLGPLFILNYGQGYDVSKLPKS